MGGTSDNTGCCVPHPPPDGHDSFSRSLWRSLILQAIHIRKRQHTDVRESCLCHTNHDSASQPTHLKQKQDRGVAKKRCTQVESKHTRSTCTNSKSEHYYTWHPSGVQNVSVVSLVYKDIINEVPMSRQRMYPVVLRLSLCWKILLVMVKCCSV